MNIYEAMSKRHKVRKYLNKPLSEDIIKKLKNRIDKNNEKYNLAIKLVLNDSNAFSGILKLFLAKGVKNYFVLAGKDTPNLHEKLGYCAADLMLYAQTLGLNTWYVGGTYSKKNVTKNAYSSEVVAIVAVGYGATQGVMHKTKKIEDVSYYNGDMPDWFKNGVIVSLFAPTALGKQAYFIKGEENKVSITCNNGIYTNQDLGLVKYHFELGAGKENFEWV